MSSVEQIRCVETGILKRCLLWVVRSVFGWTCACWKGQQDMPTSCQNALTSDGTRTRNPRLSKHLRPQCRRPMPYPLGHGGRSAERGFPNNVYPLPAFILSKDLWGSLQKGSWMQNMISNQYNSVVLHDKNAASKPRFTSYSQLSLSWARLAQSVEHQTFNLRVKGSSPLLGDQFCFFLLKIDGWVEVKWVRREVLCTRYVRVHHWIRAVYITYMAHPAQPAFWNEIQL